MDQHVDKSILDTRVFIVLSHDAKDQYNTMADPGFLEGGGAPLWIGGGGQVRWHSRLRTEILKNRLSLSKIGGARLLPPGSATVILCDGGSLWPLFKYIMNCL